jgi:hypothetical protein
MHKYILLAVAVSTVLACDKDERQLLNRTEDILPGSWYIESVRLPGNGHGITYAGVTFYHDTILYDIGTIDISSFDIQQLDLQNPNPPPVPCVLSVFNEVFPYQVDRLFISVDEAFGSFSSSAQGVNIIDTPGEIFLSDSRIFRNNYYIVIVAVDHIRLERGNDREGHVITLKRI